MKLKQLKLKGFRRYKELTTIDFENLTAFIGKNDAGKSTILEALEIFFNNTIVKIEKEDLCVSSEDNEILIGCVFENVPAHITLDSTLTSTAGEYILNEKGDLEIHQVFDCNLKTPKAKVYVNAYHPTAPDYNDLLELKNDELKKRAEKLEVILRDKRKNSIIRKQLWETAPDLECGNTLVPLDKEDGKKIWDELKKHLPIYALFQSDRENRDDDQEVQDPLAVAVQEALKEVEKELETIQEKVKQQSTLVAERTLAKLREMDADIADQLMPDFKTDPKWNSLFKLTFKGSDGIPVNKRGSGVRRLILLNFFRAEAEKRRTSVNAPAIIYAFEEPETSQHPNNQLLLLEAFKELSRQDNCQVILTTHTPALGGVIPLSSIRYVRSGATDIGRESDETYELIANTLGVLPDPVEGRVQLFVCVEGVLDIAFLKNISKNLSETNNEFLDLSVDDGRIIFIPLGGSNLKEWVNMNLLRKLNIPELHIYDSDDILKPKYKSQYDAVNARGDGHVAFMTSKREMENYVHPDAIKAVYGFSVLFGDTDDVGEAVAKQVYESDETGTGDWRSLEDGSKKKKINRAKERINKEAAKHMDEALLDAIDGSGDVKRWLNEIRLRVS